MLDGGKLHPGFTCVLLLTNPSASGSLQRALPGDEKSLRNLLSLSMPKQNKYCIAITQEA